MPRRRRRGPKRLLFGELPVDVINNTLDLELEPGKVSMSANAQVHAARKHPKDFARCQPHVAGVIADPLYLGDDERNAGKIEMVGKPPGLGEPLLVAVEIELDERGHYNVASFYPLAEWKIQARKEKGHLRIAKPKK
jgi:hypothetical protein